MIDKALVAAVRRELKAAADPARAPAMQAYMKSAVRTTSIILPGNGSDCCSDVTRLPCHG